MVIYADIFQIFKAASRRHFKKLFHEKWKHLEKRLNIAIINTYPYNIWL